MIKKQLTITGLTMDVSYTPKELETVFLPMLQHFTQLREKKKSRVIIYMAAPPGAGKTSLSLLLEDIYKESPRPYTFQSLSMDGFHHTNSYLTSHYTEINGEQTLLNEIKGKPETFDLNGLTRAIQALHKGEAVEWPIYSRSLHDVSDETIKVDADIVLIEGNYLLLNQEGWKDLVSYADLRVFLTAPRELLKKRIIERKLKGGHIKEEAVAHYERADLPNHYLIMNQSQKADWVLVLNEEEEWTIK